MKISWWREKLGLNQEKAARLLFMDVRTLQRLDRKEDLSQKLQCVMKYQEIMAQPTIDKARAVMNRHYRLHLKTRGDHWE
jgi:hypothetical protein